MKVGVWAACFVVSGCLSPLGGGGPPGPETTTGSGADGGSSTSTSSTSTGTSSSGGPTGSTTTSMGGEATGDDFVLWPDLESGERPLYDECDVFAQDCPAGEKCTWARSYEGGGPDAMRCVPLSRDPLANGAPCTYDAETLDGVDDCAARAMCFEFMASEWDGTGTCVSLCLGSGEYSYCEAGSVCIGGRVLWLCEPTCDPLAQDCPDGARCDLYGLAPLCLYDWADHGGVGADCWQQDCELGLTCMVDAVVGCGGQGCCTPFCELGDPQASCPLPGQKCLPPYDGYDPPELAGIGVCRLEAP